MTNTPSKWVRAHTNIALIKYWGKENDDLIIPKNNSLSLTLDAFYTETRVTFDDTLEKDTLILDGEEQASSVLSKVEGVLNLVREKAGITTYALVESKNYVPTAAGLASSASGLAALAGAASQAAGLDLSDTELSRLARRGSGSASRSIYGGFAEWQKGTNDEDSYAVPVDDANWDLGMLFIVVEDAKKDVSSREGMRRTIETSPFYQGWLDTVNEDLEAMKQAISNQDIEEVGKIAERNAMKMHATNLGANPPFTYWSPDSVRAMAAVRNLREKGFTAYFTMDAGPNVKIVCKQSDMRDIKQELEKEFDAHQLIEARPGPGMTILD